MKLSFSLFESRAMGVEYSPSYSEQEKRRTGEREKSQRRYTMQWVYRLSFIRLFSSSPALLLENLCVSRLCRILPPVHPMPPIRKPHRVDQ